MTNLVNLFRKVRKEKIILWIVLLSLLTINTFLTANSEQISYESNRGLSLYYYMQSVGSYIWFYFIMFFIIPNIYSVDILKKKNNHYHYFEITKKGYKNYCISNFKKNSLITFFSVLFIHVYLLFLINFFISPISADTFDQIGIYVGLNSNMMVNLILYVIFSIIGYVVFSNFILSLQLYIKNIYIYRALGIILGIVLFIVPAYLNIIFFRLEPLKFLSIIPGIFFIPNIITPSLESISIRGLSPLVGFILTLTVYFIMTLVIFKHKSIKEHIYE